MKNLAKYMILGLTLLSAVLFTGCVQEEEPDYRAEDYGYVQFKLYKEASFGTRSEMIEYLHDVAKIRVDLEFEETLFSQTLVLTAADEEKAEFGLRSDKLKLLAGDYQIDGYTLLDKVDQEIESYVPADELRHFQVVCGGLTSHSLTANVQPRGKVNFTIVKDLSDFDNIPGTKASPRSSSRQYTFDEIKAITIEVENTLTKNKVSFEQLPVKFNTLSLLCDTTLYLKAGEYIIKSYSVYDEYKANLEVSTKVRKDAFKVEDNKTVEAKVPVKLYESDEYIKDYYALYKIWDALDGENWFYVGEDYPNGCNWNFNQDPDLWGNQPGVGLHSNGRVARIDISNFGFRGELPADIGQLTELTELYLGTHNDTNVHDFDPAKDYSDKVIKAFKADSKKYLQEAALMSRKEFRTRDSRRPSRPGDKIKVELNEFNKIGLAGAWGYVSANGETVHNVSGIGFKEGDRMAANKAYMASIHPAMPFTEPIARAMVERGTFMPGCEPYDWAKEDQIFTKKGGISAMSDYMGVNKKDMISGKVNNGLTKIDPAIGNLTKLERLYIANGKLTELPSTLANLKSCTDIEVYNCPEMKKFPTVLASMPSLISINLSNNLQWSTAEANKGLSMMSTGNSRENIQILYWMETNLTTVPASMKNMKKLGLLDLSMNKIETIEAPFGKEVSLVQAYFPKNKIKSFPVDSDGLFCKTDDMEGFVADFNELTEVPDIFDAESIFSVGSISFAYNHISKFQNQDSGYKGMNAATFVLANNPELTEYPKCLAESGSIIDNLNFRGCSISSIPEGSFEGDGMINISSIDLSYNHLSDLPEKEFHSGNIPYLYGIDISYNRFSKFPWEPLDMRGLSVFAMRGQRDAKGRRIFTQWPDGIDNYQSLRALYLGSNNLGVCVGKVCPYIYYLDISDNPEISIDITDICNQVLTGYIILMYDKGQEIRGCAPLMN